MIKVLLVDDSTLVLQILKRMLDSPGSGVEVVGTALNGAEALKKIPLLNPQVICTDYHMPKMDGLQLTKEVMARYPRPILVISIAVQKGIDDTNIFQFLDAGAIDIFPKPEGGLKCDFDNLATQLIRKIRVLSGVTMFTRFSRSTISTTPQAKPVESGIDSLNHSAKILAIGASTGGPQALHDILAVLSPSISMPVICIQHISEGFLDGLIDWLSSKCALPICIAAHGEIPQNGKVYFSPENCQLTIDRNGRFSTLPGAAEELHKPSVSITFDSIAKYYTKSVIAILLTGMGSDGATGLKNIHLSNGFTIAEDESSCIVFGMPNEAIKLGAASQVWPLPKIVRALGNLK